MNERSGVSDALCALASGISKLGSLQLMGNTITPGEKLNSRRLLQTDCNEDRRSCRGAGAGEGGWIILE